MAEPTDLRAICSALEHLFLPAALCNIKDDAFVAWNPAFQKRVGLSEKELAQAQLTSLLNSSLSNFPAKLSRPT
jgi:hypothetical protein